MLHKLCAAEDFEELAGHGVAQPYTTGVLAKEEEKVNVQEMQYDLKSVLGNRMETLAEEEDEEDGLMSSLTKTNQTGEDQNTDRDQDQD